MTASDDARKTINTYRLRLQADGAQAAGDPEMAGAAGGCDGRRADRRGAVTLWKGRRGRFVWHVYRPSAPTRFGSDLWRSPVSGHRFTFSLRWVLGWVMW